MAALPYMQLYVADYLSDTSHLSTLEHGAYLLLLFNYWQRGQSFAAKDERTLNKRLATVARMSEEEWSEIRPTIEEFFEVSATEWRHSRVERDLLAVHGKSKQAQAAGIASGEARRKGQKPAGKSNGRSTDVKRKLNHTDTDTDKGLPVARGEMGSTEVNSSRYGQWTGQHQSARMASPEEAEVF